MINFEKQIKEKGFSIIIGIDEAGRGPLAGPVVAAAVSLHNYHFQNKIADSKKLTANARDRAYDEILQNAHVGVGIISEVLIDSINILQSTFLAMEKAVEDLITHLPDDEMYYPDVASQVYLLIDGNRFKSSLPYHYETVIDGDDKCLSIACASIIAKVTRDRILCRYDQIYPQYGFKNHKGYGTLQHRKVLKELGPTVIHRKSFIRSLC